MLLFLASSEVSSLASPSPASASALVLSGARTAEAGVFSTDLRSLLSFQCSS